jgi:hypothetical protein
MEDLTDRLTAIGFGCTPAEAEYWRVARIGPPTPARPARQNLHPVCRSLLAFWYDRLADPPGRATAYQIAPRVEIRANPAG